MAGSLHQISVEHKVSFGYPGGQRAPITFGMSEEPFTLSCSAERTLETPSCAAIVFTF